MKNRRKEILRFLAAIRVGDRYARRKIVRRLVPAAALVLLFASAAPASAKKITDEELQAFLRGESVDLRSAKEETPAPVSAVSAPEDAATVEAVSEMRVSAEPVSSAFFPAASASQAPAGKPRQLRKLGTPKIDFPAVSKEELEAEGRDVTLKGVVGGRSYYGIAVASAGTGGSSSEIWFNLVRGVKFAGAKSIMDFQDGDKISVVYREVAATKKRILKSVSLLQKAPKEAPEERDDDLKAGENA